MKRKVITVKNFVEILLRSIDIKFEQVESIAIRIPGRAGFMDIKDLPAEYFFREIINPRYAVITNIKNFVSSFNEKEVSFETLSIILEPDGNITFLPTGEISSLSEEDIITVLDRIQRFLEKIITIIRNIEELIRTFFSESS